MSAEQWEALADRASDWGSEEFGGAIGQEWSWYMASEFDRDEVIEGCAGLALFARLMTVAMRSAEHECNPVIFGDGEWARCSICHDDTFPVTFDAAYGLPKGTYEPFASQERTANLLSALRRYHAGSDNGELMALLCEAWGDRPKPIYEVASSAMKPGPCPRAGCGALDGVTCSGHARIEPGAWFHSERGVNQ